MNEKSRFETPVSSGQNTSDLDVIVCRNFTCHRFTFQTNYLLAPSRWHKLNQVNTEATKELA